MDRVLGYLAFALCIAGIVAALQDYRRGQKTVPIWKWHETWFFLWVAALSVRAWLSDDVFAFIGYFGLAVGVVALMVRFSRSRGR